MARDGATTVRVFSAEVGRLVGRLEHPEGRLTHVAVDWAGRRVATVVEVSDREVLRIWDADRGWSDPSVVPFPHKYLGTNSIEWWVGSTIGSSIYSDLIDAPPRSVLRLGPPIVSEMVGSNLFTPGSPGGELIQLDGGTVFETQAGRRLVPPAGRRYHPALARFAPDGRYVVSYLGAPTPFMPGVIDVRTEKSFPTGHGSPRDDSHAAGWYVNLGVPYSHLPGFGLVATTDPHAYAVGLRALPTAALGQIPADLLEAWIQVALRGEIGPDGTFVAWDEPTWEGKRQALSSRSRPDLPLPGHLAGDRLYWLREEIASVQHAPDRLRLAAELLRRAEAIGDRAEAARWRDEVATIEARLARKPAEEP